MAADISITKNANLEHNVDCIESEFACLTVQKSMNDSLSGCKRFLRYEQFLLCNSLGFP